MGLLAILQLINAATPIATNLILAVKHKDGSITTVVLLDEADAKFSQNMAEAQAWLAAHAKPVTPPITPAA
jgi:hypothetical protein